MFSVILPTRGLSPFLADAVDSVLRGPSELELLLVHDRRDGEPELDGGLVADSRVRPLRSSGAGVSSARNLALDEARGRFVAFIDDDDLWLPGHLEESAGILERHPRAIMLGSDVRIRKNDEGEAPPARLPRLHPDRETGTVPLHDLLLENLFPISTVLLRRERLLADDRFDPGLAHMEDYDLWLRLACREAPLFDARPRAIIRRHGRNASRDWRRMAEGSLRVLARFVEDRTLREALSAGEWRRREGHLWHDLAYACLVEDDPQGARRASAMALRRLPLMLKNYTYFLASGLPGAVRRALVVRGRRTLGVS